MGNLAYLANTSNQYVTATLTVSSEQAAYPKLFSQELPISKPFRFVGDSSENIQIDLGSAQTITLIAILNHNLTSSAGITVFGGSTPNPNGSQFTTTMTWREHDAFKVLSQSWRYWKIIFSDAANPDTFVQIGYVMMGSMTTLGFNFAYGWQFTDEHVNLELESEFGVQHVAEMFHRIVLDLSFQNITSANAAIIRQLQRDLKRNQIPIFLMPDAALNEGYFGRIVSHLTRTIDFYQTMQVRFLEESRGKKIG
jgi:hypothetical protein